MIGARSSKNSQGTCGCKSRSVLGYSLLWISGKIRGRPRILLDQNHRDSFFCSNVFFLYRDRKSAAIHYGGAEASTQAAGPFQKNTELLLHPLQPKCLACMFSNLIPDVQQDESMTHIPRARAAVAGNQTSMQAWPWDGIPLAIHSVCS